MKNNLLVISPSPHIHGDLNVRKLMYGVIIAMIPALLVSFYFFGVGAVKVTLLAVVSCLVFELLIQKFLIKGDTTINDGSAIITGMLLAFNVPSNLPWWIIIIGSLVAIGIAKMSFGGLGKNPFNPALVGRVFLLISFPVQMTSWPKPILSRLALTDAVTGATPLGLLKEGLGKTMENGAQPTVSQVMESADMPSYVEMLYGQIGGSLGEISVIALLLGAIYLLVKKIISWHIPVSYLGTVIIFSSILWLANPDRFVDPLFHVLTGGLLLGVFFMATDMVTSPMSAKGMLIFGVGCGIITLAIRIFGAYPEGVSFAILIMNAFVPLINLGFKPKRFGEKVKTE